MHTIVKWAIFVLMVGAIASAQETAPPVPPAPPEPPEAPAARAPRAPRTAEGAGSYLGMGIRDVTPEQTARLKLKEARGVEVLMVDQDAPAGKAGIREHDVILSFKGQQVNTAEQLRALIRKTSPGQKVTLGISRDGQPMQLQATVASRKAWAKAGGQVIHIPPIQIPAMEFDFPQFSVLQFWSRNGLVVEDLTPQLGEFFGVRGGQGVLVRSVEQGSPAAAAGLKAGDVIVKVDGEPVACSSDWRHSMRERRTGAVSLGIIRDKREQNLSMKLPERKAEVYGFDFEFPSIDFEELRREMDRLGPELRRTQRVAGREFERSMREMRQDLEQVQRDLERQW